MLRPSDRRHWATSVHAAGLLAFALLLSGCAKYKERERILSWIENSYNADSLSFPKSGHGHSAYYGHQEGPNSRTESLDQGTIESFHHNGCKVSLSIKSDPAQRINGISTSEDVSFDLKDINPTSIEVQSITHFGGFVCGKLDPDPNAFGGCDHADLLFDTVAEEKLLHRHSVTTFNELAGRDHENTQDDLAKSGYMTTDDPAYARKLASAMKRAVVLCGGTPEPF